MHYEFRFCGLGGQGLLLMGDILAKAASLNGNLNILLTKTYGAQARGGNSSSELILSDGEIVYPAVTTPDFMVALSEDICLRSISDLNERSTLIADESFAQRLSGSICTTVPLPLIRTSTHLTGSGLSANIVAIGALVKICPFIDENLVVTALSAFFSGDQLSLILRLFNSGREIASNRIHSWLTTG